MLSIRVSLWCRRPTSRHVFVMDENTLTCESINIGYEFPLNIAKKFGMQALSIQANMNDIFRCSTVKAERGIDYPFARTVSFSIGATF